MKQLKITDPIKARAAVADCISWGWKIGNFPKDMCDEDWLTLANGIIDFINEELAKNNITILPVNNATRH